MSGELILSRRNDQLHHLGGTQGGRLGVRFAVPAQLTPLFGLIGQLLPGVGPTSIGPSRSRHSVTSWSGTSVPFAFSRSMMARTPGSD